MNNNSIIRLTFLKGGRRLLRHGKYSNAVTKDILIDGKNVLQILVPSKTQLEPVYGESLQVLTLGPEFIKNCIEKMPFSYKKSSARHWKMLPEKVKIKIHLKDLEHDLNARLIDMEVIS